MTCKKCNRLMPDNMMACPACTDRANRAALRTYQLHPLRKVAEGGARLVTRHMRGGRHIQMFAWNKDAEQYTFCGEAVDPAHRRGSLTLDELVDAAERGTVCEKCHLQVGDLMVEALPCSA